MSGVKKEAGYTEKNLITRVMYGAGSVMVWDCFPYKSPENLCDIDAIKFQEVLNENLSASAKKLQLGCGWILQQDQRSITWMFKTSKVPKHVQIHIKEKVQWTQNQASVMAIPVSWPKPHWKAVRWAEEVSP